MLDWIAALGGWNWFILGALFFLLEVLAPGAFMMWLGLAALVVAIVTAFVPWPWQAQIIAFGVLALGLIPLWRRFARKVERPSDRPLLNRRAETHVGRVYRLESPIVDGIGTVRIDDSIWRVRGADAPAGGRVRVVRADGPVLDVEPAP